MASCPPSELRIYLKMRPINLGSEVQCQGGRLAVDWANKRRRRRLHLNPRWASGGAMKTARPSMIMTAQVAWAIQKALGQAAADLHGHPEPPTRAPSRSRSISAQPRALKIVCTSAQRQLPRAKNATQSSSHITPPTANKCHKCRAVSTLRWDDTPGLPMQYHCLQY